LWFPYAGIIQIRLKGIISGAIATPFMNALILQLIRAYVKEIMDIIRFFVIKKTGNLYHTTLENPGTGAA